MGNIDKIIEKFAGREGELWDKLYSLYPNKVENPEEVDPVHLMEPHERVNYEREKAALLLEEAEKAEHQKLQSHRWRTDVWSEEAEENARRLQHEIEDDDEAEALKAEVRLYHRVASLVDNLCDFESCGSCCGVWTLPKMLTKTMFLCLESEAGFLLKMQRRPGRRRPNFRAQHTH